MFLPRITPAPMKKDDHDRPHFISDKAQAAGD
jgi:hypothetical protein